MARIWIVDPPGLQLPASGGRTSGAGFEDLMYNYASERLAQLMQDTSYWLEKARYEAVDAQHFISLFWLLILHLV
ncbi:unnamed protein product [Protopolystoma xenopodis]|uniref:Uncharacterized protein n=1 Tax=Protopolystoma xenopodis TaxID=117903 RepID=A0A448WT15_9PLAT|nr:unnamed protein product [Protopolystoma xenopodis]